MPDTQSLTKTTVDNVNVPSTAHSDKFVTESIERARDSVGVINASALHSELDGLTRDDWKRASELFPKRSELPNDFYIAPNHSGDFIIHNDMSEATKIDSHSTADLRWEIIKSDFKHFSGSLPGGTMAGGLLGGIPGGILSVLGTTLPEFALAAALPIGMAAGAAYLLEWGDAQSRAKMMKSSAANDLETSRVLFANAVQAPMYVGQTGNDQKYDWDVTERAEAKRLKEEIKFN